MGEPIPFPQPGAARAGGYTLLVAGILVAVGLVFHPPPSQGFAESPSVLQNTPWWGLIHVMIAIGFVLCVQGGLLVLVSGSVLTQRWWTAWCWGALTVGMIYFTGVSLVNGWVMHPLALHLPENQALYDAMDNLLIGFGWLGNPLFLLGLTGIAFGEVRYGFLGMQKWGAWFGLVVVILSWGRGIGSATGLYFLEPLIFANVPAFLWLGYYGYLITKRATLPA